MKIGQNLNCVIVEVKNDGRVVHLSIDRSEVAASLATEQQNWTLSNLLPGLVVKARVQKVSSGLGLVFWVVFFFLSHAEGRETGEVEMEVYALENFVLEFNYFTIASTVMYWTLPHLGSDLCPGCDAMSIKASAWSWC